MKSYDDNQIGAVLVTCATCKRSYYMVKPDRICFDCGPGNVPMRDRVQPQRLTDVSGNMLYE